MLGHSRWSSGMLVNTPVALRKSTSPCAHGIPRWSARASTRPIRNWLTTRVPNRPAVGDLPVLGVLHEHTVTRFDEIRGVGVLIAGLRVPEEHPAEPGQILVSTNGKLVLYLRKRPHRLVVALRGRGIRGREPVVPNGQLRQPRESRLRNGVVREWRAGHRIDNRRVEASRQLLRRRHRVEVRRAAVDPCALVVHQEERAIPAIVPGNHDRTAHDEAELLLIEQRRRRGLVVEEVSRVPGVVPEEPEPRPVQGVRAGLADQVDLVRAEAVLGGVGRGLFLEFLDGVDGQDRRRRTD